MFGVRFAVGQNADVMHEQKAELVAAHPLLAVVKAAHDTIIGVVEHLLERQAVLPTRIKRVLGWKWRKQATRARVVEQAADFGAYDRI